MLLSQFQKNEVYMKYINCSKGEDQKETRIRITKKCTINKGNNKITELRTILQRESQNS